MKKPRLKKIPKMPRVKSAANLEKYYKKLEAVEKYNAEKQRPYQKEVQQKELLLKKIEKKKTAIRGL